MNQLIIRNDVHRLSKNKSFINTFFLILILFLYYSLEPINLVMLVIVYMLISKKIMLISKKKIRESPIGMKRYLVAVLIKVFSK